MRRYVVCFLVLGMLTSNLLAWAVEIVEPSGIAEVYFSPYPSLECLDDSCYTFIQHINTDNASSNAFQPFIFRVTSSGGVDWSTLSFVITSGGGMICCYPSSPGDCRYCGWWLDWVGPICGTSYHEQMWRANELSYDLFIDTLADTSWLVSIIPGSKIQPRGFIWDTTCSFPIEDVWQNTGDTLSPGFGQSFMIGGGMAVNFLTVTVRDTLGVRFGTGYRGIGFDFNGPSASCP